METWLISSFCLHSTNTRMKLSIIISSLAVVLLSHSAFSSTETRLVVDTPHLVDTHHLVDTLQTLDPQLPLDIPLDNQLPLDTLPVIALSDGRSRGRGDGWARRRGEDRRRGRGDRRGRGREDRRGRRGRGERRFGRGGDDRRGRRGRGDRGFGRRGDDRWFDRRGRGDRGFGRRGDGDRWFDRRGRDGYRSRDLGFAYSDNQSSLDMNGPTVNDNIMRKVENAIRNNKPITITYRTD